MMKTEGLTHTIKSMFSFNLPLPPYAANAVDYKAIVAIY